MSMIELPAAEITDFIGRGWSFPIRLTGSGGIAMNTGEDEITAALMMILSTAPGERVMRPEFGCEIWDQLFASITPSTLGVMEHAVRRAVARWEPRIDLESVQAKPDPDQQGVVVIEIGYLTKATNDRRNLVFPFYVIPGEETS